jgi:hypothetical protein
MQIADVSASDRRNRRSDDLATALRFLLAAQRDRAGLTHLILANSEGMLIAWDGDVAECEELAAYAPFIARGEGYVLDSRRLAGVSVHTFKVRNDEELLLLLRSPLRGAILGEADSLASTLLSSIEGVARRGASPDGQDPPQARFAQRPRPPLPRRLPLRPRRRTPTASQ